MHCNQEGAFSSGFHDANSLDPCSNIQPVPKDESVQQFCSKKILLAAPFLCVYTTCASVSALLENVMRCWVLLKCFS